MIIREICKRKISNDYSEEYFGDRKFKSFQEVKGYIFEKYDEKKLLDNIICKFMVMDTLEEISVCVYSIYSDNEYIGNELICEV